MAHKKSYYVERAAAFIAALILLQTLYFKFTADPSSVSLFTQIGGEPYTRIGSGIIELFTVVLLVFRKTSHLGALVGAAVMTGAVGLHLIKLGIIVNDDGGTLFLLAIITLTCCLIVLYLKRAEILNLRKKISD